MKFQICLIFLIIGNAYCQYENLSVKGLSHLANELLDALKAIPDPDNYFSLDDNYKLRLLLGALLKEIPILLNDANQFETKYLMVTGGLEMLNEIKTSFIPRLRNLRSIHNLESAITPDLVSAGNKFSKGLYALTSSNPNNYIPRSMSALKMLDAKVVKVVSKIVPVALTYYQY